MKTRAITEANEQIDTLKADIQKYAADVKQLGKEIAELDEDISIGMATSRRRPTFATSKRQTTMLCTKTTPS